MQQRLPGEEQILLGHIADRAGRPVTSRPSKKTRPLSGRISPAAIFSKVLFPDPLGPSRETNSPGATCSERASITGSGSAPAV